MGAAVVENANAAFAIPEGDQFLAKNHQANGISVSEHLA